jgi:hypothetical protein
LGLSPDSVPAGERDLVVLLASLDPELHPGRYVFALAPGDGIPAGADIVATIREEEGLTLVLAQADADRAGLAYDVALQWITLRVHSALDGVGLTAAFSTALAVGGLSANVIAGLHHDHVFVPTGQGEQALRVLRALAGAGRPGPGS